MINLDFTNIDEVETQFGWYRISASVVRELNHYAHLEYRFGTYTQSIGVPVDTSCYYDSRDEAVEACQKDYRRRVNATIRQAYGPSWAICHCVKEPKVTG